MFNRERYRTFYIPKKSGKYRLVEEPNSELKTLQREIVKNLRTIQWPNYLFGLGKNAIDNAKAHYEQKIIIKFDISDFFRTTTLGHYYLALEKIGLNQEFFRLTRDCFIRDNKNPGIIRLPTGAPTSPFLASISFWPTDLYLVKLSTSLGLKYTRYVDDLTFSGNEYPRGLEKEVSKIAYRAGFRINFSKTETCFRNSNSQLVTGVLLNYLPTASREYRYNLRAELDQLARNNSSLNESVTGKINYLRQLQPDKANQLLNYFEKRRNRYGFK